ncbi:ras association domain-containing protein 7-like isoform X2 [Notolabrus celidotus]|uniref:ras association domain-containing protein 7-like isoform X2 n=1 Tax=Notolabrus celidotus TaxID=1203425 RepID=UPI00148F5042|nr:ras association domain-containing protein 7-like isoform X2 [Notolabrus celidotus]
MELKVWVEGVVRVVCGLSLNTTCQDVVIALAQSIGQTGRYILFLKLRGTERQLVAEDCPLRLLSQLGQQATEVQFLLRRTGPSLSDGRDTTSGERGVPLHRPSEPDPPRSREPHKALTFNLGPSTNPRRTKPNRAWSPSPRASPELRASPVSFIDPLNPVNISKDEVFRQILQQQRRLQDLEIQLQALERDTEVWELEESAASVSSLDVVSERELEELEQRLSLNQAELMHSEDWERQLQEEMDRERDMQRRLHEIQLSMDDHGFHISELHARSAHLEQDLKLRAQRHSSQTGPRQPDQALKPLKQELHHRLKQGDDLDARLTVTQRELQAAEEQLQVGADGGTEQGTETV